MDQDLASRQEARELGKRAEEAQRILRTFSQEKLDGIVQAVSRAFLEHARELGRMACEETGFGNPQDKEIKNRFAASRVWEAIRSQRTVGIRERIPSKKSGTWAFRWASSQPSSPRPIPPPPFATRP